MEEQLESIQKLCNNLTINDKRARKRNLEQLYSEIFKDPQNEHLRQIFDQIYIHVLKCFNDSSEDCREIAIRIMENFIKHLDKNDYYLTYILPVVEKRLGDVIIVEESEEIRLQLVTFIHEIIKKYQDLMLPFLDLCAKILTKTVLDPYPKVKHESCLCISTLTKALPKHFHLQSETFLKAVVQLLSHQHFKIRVAAIQSISDIVEHSSGKIPEDVLVGLACLMNDKVPSVRLAVIRTAHAWLLRQPDRYSYFPQILPLILLGLTDEVPANVEDASRLWKDVGKQYTEENEKDFKDKMDFLEEIIPHYPIAIEQRPTIGCRMLVVRNTMRLLAAITNELNDWKLEIRQMASRLLCTVVLHNEDDITQHLQNLLPEMAKGCKDVDHEVRTNVQEAARIVGHFVKPAVYCDIILPVLDGNTGPTIGQLRVLASLITGSTPDDLSEKLDSICDCLLHPDICQTRKFGADILNCCQKIITIGQERCALVEYKLFTLIITVLALSEEPTRTIANQQLSTLAEKLNVTVDELYKKHSGALLQILKPSANAWTVPTPERCIFETLLQHSNFSSDDNLQVIIDILENCLNKNEDAEVRLKIFLVLSKVLVEIEDTDTNSEFTTKMEYIIRNIIEPNLIWHAGRTSESLRSTAVASLCACLPYCANNIPVELINKLLGLLDERSSTTRIHVLRAIGCLAEAHKNQISSDQINQYYPEILKRLDDGIDNVRIEAAKTLKIVWESLDFESYKARGTHQAHVDFLYSTLLIHLDDQDDNFQKEIFDVLKVVSRLDKEFLKGKLQKNKQKFRNKDICDALISFLNTE